MNRYPMFSPQQLLSFVAVCETGSFTRAADRVYLSQSTVSQQIRRLEEALGKPLLERTSHQVKLTEEGERLLGYARRIIALNGEAHDALSDQWPDGVVRLGVPEDFAAATTSLLAQFSPRSSTVPASGAVSPSQISIVVVFPAPFGPSSPKHSPRMTSRSRPSIATTSANALSRPRSRSAG